MEHARPADTESLRQELARTRESIRGTVGELRSRVDEARSWRTYVARYPVATLAGAAVIGLWAGRKVGFGLHGSDAGARRATIHAFSEGGTVPGVTGAGGRAADAHAGRASGVRMWLGASWGRVGDRVEALVNRMIDELGDAAEHRLLPGLMRHVHAFLAGRGMAGAEAPSWARGFQGPRAGDEEEPGQRGAAAGRAAYPRRAAAERRVRERHAAGPE